MVVYFSEVNMQSYKIVVTFLSRFTKQVFYQASRAVKLLDFPYICGTFKKMTAWEVENP